MNQYIGYARVSTDSQNLDLPRGTRLKTGCEPFYKEAVSGKSAVRPELERQDIAFESLTEKIETNSTAGKLVFHVFTALAEFEQNLVREWTHASLAAINSCGIKSGRKPALMPQQVHEIKALSRSLSISVASITDHYWVSRATIYKHAEVDAPARYQSGPSDDPAKGANRI